ncbi:MAG: hypothetical protein H7331_09915 [Bacteroidia bacterium]|nr:hypothetical protein [Bacteroidia bacterium]
MNTYSKFYFLICLLALACNCKAQEFCKTIAMATATHGKLITKTATGYVIVGESSNNNYTRKEVLVYTTNKNGIVLQATTYGGNESYAINDFRMNANGGITLLAERYLKKRESLLLMNIDSVANVLQAVPYDENGAEVEPYAVVQTNVGDNIIVGFTKLITPIEGGFYTANKEDQYFYVLKTNVKGNKLWSKYIDFGAGSTSAATSIIKTSATEFIIVGYCIKNKVGETVIVKINDAGNVLWSKRIVGSMQNFKTLTLLSNNTIALVGTKQTTKNNTTISITNLNLNGNLLWAKTYGGIYSSSARGVSSNKQGIILTGITQTSTKGTNKVCVLNINYNGLLNWANTYNTGTFNNVSNPVLDKEYIVFTGLTYGDSAGVKSILCKYKNEFKKERNVVFKTSINTIQLIPYKLQFTPLNQPIFAGTYTPKDTKVAKVILKSTDIKF